MAIRSAKFNGHDASLALAAIAYAAGGEIKFPVQALEAVHDPRKQFEVVYERDATGSGCTVRLIRDGAPMKPRPPLALVPIEGECTRVDGTSA